MDDQPHEQTPHERRVVEEREERFGTEADEPAGPETRYTGDQGGEDYEEEIEAERTGRSSDR